MEKTLTEEQLKRIEKHVEKHLDKALEGPTFDALMMLCVDFVAMTQRDLCEEHAQDAAWDIAFDRVHESLWLDGKRLVETSPGLSLVSN